MTTQVRWPLRFGFTALVTMDGDPAEAPVVDPRQAHMVGCRCDECLAREAAIATRTTQEARR